MSDKVKFTKFMRGLVKKMEEKGLSPTTINNYMMRMYVLNGKKTFTSLTFLRKPNEVIEKLKEKYSPSSQKSIIGSILAILEHHPIKSNMKVKSIYMDYLTDNAEVLVGDKGAKTEKQEANWLTKEDLDKVKEDKMESLKKGASSMKAYNDKLDYAILSLYMDMPPRRAKDYVLMKYTTKEEEDTDFNYFNTTTNEFVFNNFKTAKSHGQERVKPPKSVLSALDLFNKEEGAFVIRKANGKPFNLINDMTKRLNNIFGKKISVDMLRNMYYSHKYGEVKKEIIQDAKDMGTSLNNAINTYTKD
jgi:hypothetical protein